MICATIVVSGKNDNCTLVRGGQTSVLVDSGANADLIESTLLGAGLSLQQLSGILITHEHGDHTKALPEICARFRVPVFANSLTADCLKRSKVPTQWCVFLTGSPFQLGELTIHPFPVPHDAVDPVGFVISRGNSRLAIATDLGHASDQVISNLKGIGGVILGANHDIPMLKENPKLSSSAKARILSRHGLLSNEEVASLVASITSDMLRHVVLTHLSEDINTRTLAMQAVTDRFNAAGDTSPRIHCPAAPDDAFPFSIEI
jgi:phosphoribosyl 1,2-cyclic phosphodiesterase